jgi:hypothetical protein
MRTGAAAFFLVACTQQHAAAPSSTVAAAAPASSVTTGTTTSSDPAADLFDDECSELDKTGGGGTCTKPVSPDQIRENVLARLDRVRVCYDDALTRQPKAHGKVFVKWHITDAGAIDCMTVVHDEIRDREFRVCLVRALADMKYTTTCAASASWGFGLTPPN